MDEFLKTVRELDYPAEHVHLYIYNNQLQSEKLVQQFASESSYAKVKEVNMDVDVMDERQGRTDSMWV